MFLRNSDGDLVRGLEGKCTRKRGSRLIHATDDEEEVTRLQTWQGTAGVFWQARRSRQLLISPALLVTKHLFAVPMGYQAHSFNDHHHLEDTVVSGEEEEYSNYG